jgi:type I restriction enzyme R subunit
MNVIPASSALRSVAMLCSSALRPYARRYETTATETHFTNTLDPTPRSREVFSFHRPETLAR